MKQRIAQLLSLLDVKERRLAGQPAHPGDVARPLRHADRAARVEHVEDVRALEHQVVPRRQDPLVEQAHRLGLVAVEKLTVEAYVGLLEIEPGELDLVLPRQLPEADARRPFEVEEALDSLQERRDASETVRDLGRHDVEFHASGLLEVGELSDLHPVDPHLPPESGRTQGRRLPVVHHEPHVVFLECYADGTKALEVDVEDIGRSRFQEHLILQELLHAYRVLAVASVLGPPRGLDVGGLPRLRPEAAEERGRVERPGAHLRVVRLDDHAAVVGPVPLEIENDVLKEHGLSSLPCGWAPRPAASASPFPAIPARGATSYGVPDRSSARGASEGRAPPHPSHIR